MRVLVTAALSGLLVIASLGSSPAHGDATCTERFDGPSSGRVNVPTTGVVPGTAVGLSLALDGNTDAMIWDSVVFHVSGPDGAVDVKPYDENGDAEFKPAHEGTFSASATWTRYDCKDIGRQTTTGGSAPAAEFQVVHGNPPTMRVWSTRRPGHKAARIPSDAAVHVHADCGPDEVATHDPMRVDLWWTTNGRPASHSSRHVGSRGNHGCFGPHFTRTKDYESRLLNAGAAGDGAFIDVFEPKRADVLIEVRSGATLVGSKRARIRMTRSGMRVSFET